MQQDRRLILFTNYYPFYKGEEYIENEISIMASSFQKVMIVPTMVDKTMKQTREVPENVEVLNIKTDCSKKGKVDMVLRKAPAVIKSIDWKHAVKKETGLLLNKIAYEIYYFCRVEYVYERIVNDVQFNHFIDEGEQIILYSYWMHVVASITARLKERKFNKCVKCITRGHRYDLYAYAAPCGFVPDREYMLSIMDEIYPCSQDGVDYLQRLFPKYSEKIKVQRLGTMKQDVIECNRNPVFTMVSCAGVRKVKRLDKIIDVTSLLVSEGVNIRWVHLGDGLDLDAMKKYASSKLPEESFCFMGRLKNSEVYDWYRSNSVSCFINLSDSEGVPVAIMEAMSFGIPIVATDVGGTREIVENEKNGFIVNKDDSVEKVKTCVKYIWSLDEYSYKKMCENSFNIWNHTANASIIYENFYNQLLS